jgi:hypothetical protein
VVVVARFPCPCQSSGPMSWMPVVEICDDFLLESVG